jgi:CHAT domain-containing protein/Tol biopolymer transport system component/predicted negative regulator of RcsB-dependent stress response
LNRFIQIIICTGFLVTLSFGNNELPEIRQITTHPQTDLQPAVSPDGRWLAFVSSRSGNLDIWLKPLPRGRAIQITKDRSEDQQPAWTPDSKAIIFMSRRRDALGDLWRIRIDDRSGKPKGKAEQITQYLGWDQSPAVSPDGLYVAYVSDMHGDLSIHFLNLKTRKIRVLNSGGSTAPKWSPDGQWLVFTNFSLNAYGNLMLAHMTPFLTGGEAEFYALTRGSFIDDQADWSDDGQWIVFQRISYDTNEDGQVSPDDHSSLWEKQIPESKDTTLAGQPEYQITSDLYNDLSPNWSDSLVYFASYRGGGEDIWVLPAHGLIPHLSSVEAQYQAVFDRFGLAVTPPALHQAILGYRQVLSQFPNDSLWCARAWSHIGELLLFLGQFDHARQAYQTVRLFFQHWPREVAEATVKQAAIPTDSIENRIRLCERVIEEFPDQLFAVNEARLLLGDLYRETGESGQSVAAYSDVVQSGSRFTSLIAQARLKIGDLFQSQGQDETARQSYLAVLREYGETPLWRQRATERIMNQVKGSLYDQISAYQEIQIQGADLPALVVEAQLAIGQTLIDAEQFKAAIRELEQVDLLAPDLRWAQAKSRLLLAQAYRLQSDFLKARQFLLEIMEKYEDVEGGRYRNEAESQLFQLAFETAEQSRALHDFPLAAARYQVALNLRPDDIRVHRGLIESVYYWQRQRQNHKLDSLIVFYENKLHESPDQPIIQYSLGLALSYAGERSIDELKKSNSHLLSALENDYRMIYPYQTLGYNYELMERLTEIERNRQAGLFEQAGRVLVTPVRWIVRIFNPKKEGPVQYSERAIEVLTTAIELNDEKSNPRMEAELAQNLANNFYNLGEYGFSKAFRYYKQRLEIDTTFNTPLAKAIFFSRAGHCALGLDEFESSEMFLKISIQLFKSLGREPLMIQDLGRLGYLYQNHGDHQEAIEVYTQLAAIDERNRQWDALIRDYRNIAYNFHLIWEPEDAVLYAEKAEKILQTQNIPKGPPEKSYLRWEFFGFSIPIWGLEEIGASSSEGFTLAEEAALIFVIISQNAERLKDFSKAIIYEEKRREIFNDRRDKLAQRISTNRLGILLIKQGQYEKAWEQFFAAYEMSRKAGDDRGSWTNSLNMGNVAAILLSENDPSKLEISRQILIKEAERVQETVSYELMAIYSSLGMLGCSEVKLIKNTDTPVYETVEKLQKLGQADDYLGRAIAMAQYLKLWREEGILLKTRAEIAVMTGENDYAAQLLKQAEMQFEMGGDTYYLWRVHYSMAQLSAELAKEQRDLLGIGDALTYYQISIEELEGLPVSEEDSELWLADRPDRWHLYIDAAQAYADAGFIDKSFELIEKGKEKRVADILARRPPHLRRERHNNLWRNIRDIRAQIADLHRQIMTAEMRQESIQKQADLKKREQLLRDEYTTFLAEIQNEDPILAYLSGTAPVHIEALSSDLENRGVIAFVQNKEGLLLYALDRDSVQVYPIQCDNDSLGFKVRKLAGYLAEGSNSAALIADLSHTLLSPIYGWLQNKTHLILIPDGFLWQVPFEILKWDDEPLVNFFTLSYAPSVMMYQLARSHRRINQNQMLLVGDTWNKELTDVPQKTIALLGSEATESRLKEQAVQADFIHFERWMLPNEQSPLQASIIIFSDARNDGYIRPEEIFSWDLQASLVKLPVSRSLPDARSLEILTCALIYSGVPSIIFTRWAIPADQIIQFFRYFYSQTDRLSLCEALAKAQTHFNETEGLALTADNYGLIGFEGLNAPEKLDFAKQNLVATVVTGRNYVQMGEYEDAIGQFEKALTMAESLKDSTSMRGIMLEVIRAGMQGENWTKTITYQKRMIDQFGSKVNQDVAQQNLVTFYFNNGQFNEAAAAKKKTIEVYKSQNRWQDVAKSSIEMAVIYATARDYDVSIQWANEAYLTYLSLDDALGKARSLIWKGRSLLDADRYFEARAAFSLAIEILGQSEDEDMGPAQVFDLATAYQLRGICLENLSLYQEALTDQQFALSLLAGLDRPVQVAQGEQYLANVFWKMGAYRQALLHQNKALEAFETQGQRKQLAMAYSTQGLIEMSLGELIKAKNSEDKAFQMAQAIQSHEDEATILKNMGQIAIQAEDLETAFTYFQQATSIDSSLELRRGLSYDYRNQGMLLIQMRKFGQAIRKLESGLKLAQSVADLRNQVQCYYGMGVAHYRIGHFREALTAADSGLVLSEQLVIPELTWRLHRLRGQIYWSLRNRDEALKDFESAVETVEKLRAELKIEAFKQGFFDSKMDLYHDIIRLLLEMQQRAKAFHYVERAKSRDFIDLLGNQPIAVPENQKVFLEKEKSLKILIDEARNQIAQLRDFNVEQQRESWKDSLQVLRSQYEALLIDIQNSDPELASLVSVDPLTAEQLQTHLPSNVKLIEYFWGPGTGYCWVVDSESIRLALINVTQEQLAITIESLREGLISHLSVEQEASQLYDWLLAPVGDFLNGTDHLIIVPHGILHYLPFSVLKQGSEYLIDRFSLSLVPSSTVLGYCLDKGGRFPENPEQIVVTAFGNPDLGDKAYDLSYAEKEILSLERSFPQLTAFTRQEASEEQVKQWVGNENILHFACHATYEPEAPLFSSLLLRATDGEDGRLEAQEIFGLRLNCNLVTLSACETGLGSITQGDEIIGLSRSFIYAGTPSILTSLWKVDDLATAVMMKRFYRYLAAGSTRAEALRQAQLVVRNLVNPHPSAWAAFYITGDYR